MPKTYFTSSKTKLDSTGVKHLRSISVSERKDRAKNWRLSECGICGENTFLLDDYWHHENAWLDKEHRATPRGQNGN